VAQTFELFSRFKRGETSIEDSECSGHTDENVENVRKIFIEDRRNTTTKTAGRLGLLYGTCQPKRPERWRNQDWLLHHDNAPAHTAFVCAAIFAR
jgi:hypothetical protein